MTTPREIIPAERTVEPSAKKSAGRSMPMSDWLVLVLAEIERRNAEASAAAEERERRS
ncbi:MAG: hypothetical protein WD795_16160 [Woeseia sp.]